MTSFKPASSKVFNRFRASLIGMPLLLLLGCAPDPVPRPEKTNATQAAEPPAPPARPVLTVSTTRTEARLWTTRITSTGSISAWQESVISAEIAGYPLVELHAEIGDRVRKGTLLARLDRERIDLEVAEYRAQLAEAEASLRDAEANRQRAQELQSKGFYSPQQATREITSADTARARRDAALSRLNQSTLRQRKTDLRAPDDGVIIARSASLGMLSEPGKELFRMIRQGRLEWRAELGSDDLKRLQIGQKVMLTVENHSPISGVIRQIAPSLAPQTRTGLAYVDLPPEAASFLRAGEFVRGAFLLAPRQTQTLPQSALLLRDGFSYVFLTEPNGQDGQARVRLLKIQTGEMLEDRVEVFGLPPEQTVVSQGVSFLAEGDTVQLHRPQPAPASR